MGGAGWSMRPNMQIEKKRHFLTETTLEYSLIFYRFQEMYKKMEEVTNTNIISTIIFTTIK